MAIIPARLMKTGIPKGVGLGTSQTRLPVPGRVLAPPAPLAPMQSSPVPANPPMVTLGLRRFAPLFRGDTSPGMGTSALHSIYLGAQAFASGIGHWFDAHPMVARIISLPALMMMGIPGEPSVKMRWPRTGTPPDDQDNLITIHGQSQTMADWIRTARTMWIAKLAGKTVATGLFSAYVLDVNTHAKIMLDTWEYVNQEGFLHSVGCFLNGSPVMEYLPVALLSSVHLLGYAVRRGRSGNQFPTKHLILVSPKNFAETMAVWYDRALRLDDTTFQHNTKILDGKTYNMFQLMDMGPFWKMASNNFAAARYLRRIGSGTGTRQWTDADQVAIRSLPIRWAGDTANHHEISLVASWLESMGNKAIVDWVYARARDGNIQCRDIFEGWIGNGSEYAFSLARAHIETPFVPEPVVPVDAAQGLQLPAANDAEAWDRLGATAAQSQPLRHALARAFTEAHRAGDEALIRRIVAALSVGTPPVDKGTHLRSE